MPREFHCISFFLLWRCTYFRPSSMCRHVCSRKSGRIAMSYMKITTNSVGVEWCDAIHETYNK